jgi:hypothetical protein
MSGLTCMILQMIVWVRALTSWHPCLPVAGESLPEIHTGLIEDKGRGLGVTTQLTLLILLIFSKIQLALRRASGLVLFRLVAELHVGTILWWLI